MTTTCTSSKFSVLSLTKMEDELLVAVNRFFRKKRQEDKKAIASKSKKLEFQVDNENFELVNDKGVSLLSCRRIQKVDVNDSIIEIENILSKIKNELLQTKYNILFELVDSFSYSEVLENIVEPLERDYDNLREKIKKLYEFRMNVFKQIEHKKRELLLQKSTLKEQLIISSKEGNIDGKKELLKQYIDNQNKLLEYNKFLDDEINLFLETNKIDLKTGNNSYLETILSNSEREIEETSSSKSTLSNNNNHEDNNDEVNNDEEDNLLDNREKNDLIEAIEIEE